MAVETTVAHVVIMVRDAVITAGDAVILHQDLGVTRRVGAIGPQALTVAILVV